MYNKTFSSQGISKGWRLFRDPVMIGGLLALILGTVWFCSYLV